MTCFLPFGKVDDTASPSLPRVRGSTLQLHPRTPWTCGILDFCNDRVYLQMMGSDNYSGGLLVVPISAYFIWSRWEKLQTLDLKPDWRAFSVLLLAAVIFIVGELGAELYTTRGSMLVFVIGSVWLLFGIEALKTLHFPLAFLFLILPLPGFVYRNLTFPRADSPFCHRGRQWSRRFG